MLFQNLFQKENKSQMLKWRISDTEELKKNIGRADAERKWGVPIWQHPPSEYIRCLVLYSTQSILNLSQVKTLCSWTFSTRHCFIPLHHNENVFLLCKHLQGSRQGWTRWSILAVTEQVWQNRIAIYLSLIIKTQ